MMRLHVDNPSRGEKSTTQKESGGRFFFLGVGREGGKQEHKKTKEKLRT